MKFKKEDQAKALAYAKDAGIKAVRYGDKMLKAESKAKMREV